MVFRASWCEHVLFETENVQRVITAISIDLCKKLSAYNLMADIC
jgi:hypothetical protein